MKRVFAEIEAFKASGPTEKQLADAKEGFIRDYETSIKTNGYLLQQISVKYQFQEDNELSVLFDLPAWYGRLTAAGIQDAAKRYLNRQRYVKVTLMPEKR
jgi:zinc protease